MNLDETTQKWVSLTHSPSVAQITLGYIKISFSLSEVDCSHLLQSFTAVHASETCLYFSTNKCSYFSHIFKLPYIFSTVISLIPGTKQAFYIENGFQCSLFWCLQLFCWTQLNTNTEADLNEIKLWNFYFVSWAKFGKSEVVQVCLQVKKGDCLIGMYQNYLETHVKYG
jgi:hypothetical protein